MAQKTNIFEKIKLKNLFKNKHITRAVIIGLLCVVVLIAISSFSSTSSNKKTSQSISTSSSALDYANSVAQDLQEILNSVKGVKNAKVIVVVEESPTVKYLTETSSSGESVVVYDKQGSSYTPVAVAEFLPKISGVLVVAKGVSDLSVKYNLLNAISTVYSIDVSKIDILEGK